MCGHYGRSMEVLHNLKKQDCPIQLHQSYVYTQKNPKTALPQKVPARIILTEILFTIKDASQLKCPSTDEAK